MTVRQPLFPESQSLQRDSNVRLVTATAEAEAARSEVIGRNAADTDHKPRPWHLTEHAFPVELKELMLSMQSAC